MNIDNYCGVIDMKLLMDPATIAGEPANYELETLRQYVSKSHISPTTRKTISEKDLSRSDSLRHEIQSIVANEADPTDMEIQEARQFNLTCINVEYKAYCNTLLSTRCPSANTLMYLYCLLKDSMHLVSNCRDYTDDYITVLKSDLNQLRAYQDEGGYYHLTNKRKTTLRLCGGCICGFQRGRRNPWVKKLLFLNSCWHLVTFSMPSASGEIRVVNSVRPNRVEWITGARDNADIWIDDKRMEVTAKFAKYESEMTYMFELECIHNGGVVFQNG
jgi:hypothetical protein